MTRRLLLAIALLVTACGGDSAAGGSPHFAAGMVEVLQGDGQIDTVGQQLPVPIRIVVLDTNGASPTAGLAPPEGIPVPVPGQLVNFVVVSGGGSVFAGAALTDSAGHAQEVWTLGPTAGAQCLEARAVDQATGQPITFAQVCATGLPGPLAASGFAIDSARVFGDTTFLVPAFARDAFNNPLPIPALGNPDGLLLAPERNSWRVAFGRGGLSRLALGGDTLYLYAFDPRGKYRWVRHHGDTTWTEIGALRFVPPPDGVFCPGLPGAQPAKNIRQMAADSIRLLREVLGAPTDTLIVYYPNLSGFRGCSLVEDALTDPLRPKAAPAWSTWHTITYLGGFTPSTSFYSGNMSGPFVYAAANGPLDNPATFVDTLWLGLP